MVSSTNLLLTWLAVADLMTMVSYLPISIHFYIMKPPYLEFPASEQYLWVVFMIFQINFSVVCHTIAIWLTIALAIFRFVYICYPISGQRLCTLARAKITILAVYVSTAICCITNYLATVIRERQTLVEGIEAINGTDYKQPIRSNITYFTLSSIENKKFIQVNYWIQSTIVKLIPCVLLTILTILLISAMRKANRRRMQLMSQGKKGESEREQETNRTTGMLLAIVALFLITELPQGILTFISIFVPSVFVDIYVPLADIFDIMALLNNSINFVLYCTMSRQFRKTFTEIFCHCCSNLPIKNPAGWLRVKVFHTTVDDDVTSTGKSISTNV